jgi:DNA-binding MarR family transcriptional regulator
MVPRAPSRLNGADYQMLAQLRYLLRRFAACSEAAARGAGLTTQQHQALLAVRGFAGPGHISVGELAERLQLRHHSTVGLIDRLAARDLLRRHSDRRDRRRVLLKVTPRGQARLARLSRAHREELARLAPLRRSLLRRLGEREPTARSARAGSRSG